MPRTQIDTAVKKIEFARNYSNQLIADLTPEDWFRQPVEGVTHIAWQVGHLGMAQYALTMVRIRGREPEDKKLISNNFFRMFQKGSKPSPHASDYPPIEAILETVANIHRQSLTELAGYSDDDLSENLPEPYAVFDTKLGSVIFCSAHEMLHAGQIGLIRRLLGKEPVR